MLGTAASWTADRARRTMPVLAGSAALVVAAYVYAYGLDPSISALALAVAILGWFAYRWPATTIAIAFAMSGSYGSLRAFFKLPANGVATAMLAGLAAACLGVLLFGRRKHAVVIWPAAVLVTVYLIALAVMIPFSPALAPAVKVARTGGLYMLGFLLIAYGPWRSATHTRARNAIVLISLAVGAYATLRWAIGASAKERAVVQDLVFNQTTLGKNKVQGSFPSGVELGVWTSNVIPFLLATLLAQRGRIRVAAMVALPLCVIGLLGSSLRSGVVSAVAGCATVLLLYAFALSMPATRPVVLGAVLAALLGGAVVAFPTVVGHDPNSVRRYQNILHPGQDTSVQGRLSKWQQALHDLHGHPFGLGLGTVGPEAAGQRYISNTNSALDSSYLRIGYEQGLAVMGLFIAALVFLLAGLVRRSVVTRERDRAGPAIGAAGTLVAFMVTMIGELITSAPAALAPWVIIGLGVAPFTRLEARDAVRSAVGGRALAPSPSR
jgi:uncharacterized membrane protein